MQIIQYGYGFVTPLKNIDISSLYHELQEEKYIDISYCWDENLANDNQDKLIFVFSSGYKFVNGIIPYSFHQTNGINIQTVLREGITSLLDKLYIKYVNKQIDYSQICWRFFSYYSTKN